MKNIKKQVSIERIIKDTENSVERAISQYHSGEDFRTSVIRAKRNISFVCMHCVKGEDFEAFYSELMDLTSFNELFYYPDIARFINEKLIV